MPISGTNFFRIGAGRWTETMSLSTPPQATMTFAGPSVDRYNFLSLLFGTAVRGSAVITGPCGYQQLTQGAGGTLAPQPGDQARAWAASCNTDRWNDLFAETALVREQPNARVPPMNNCGDPVDSSCLIFIDVTYRRRGNVANTTGTGPQLPLNTWVEFEPPHFGLGSIQDPHRSLQWGLGPDVEKIPDPLQRRGNQEIAAQANATTTKAMQNTLRFTTGTWSFIWRNIPNADMAVMSRYIGTTNDRPYFGFPPDSLMFVGLEPVETNSVHPFLKAYDLRFNFEIKLGIASSWDMDARNTVPESGSRYAIGETPGQPQDRQMMINQVGLWNRAWAKLTDPTGHRWHLVALRGRDPALPNSTPVLRLRFDNPPGNFTTVGLLRIV